MYLFPLNSSAGSSLLKDRMETSLSMADNFQERRTSWKINLFFKSKTLNMKALGIRKGLGGGGGGGGWRFLIRIFYLLGSWIFIPLLVFSLLRYSLLVTALLCLVTPHSRFLLIYIRECRRMSKSIFKPNQHSANCRCKTCLLSYLT